MGDLMEITTWPRQQNVFYQVTSSALMFDVIASGNAGVGLAKKPGASCNYWVVIGDNDRCWIQTEDKRSKIVATPNILNANETRTFWITWNNDKISFGRHGENKPIVTHPSETPDLKYVTFTTLGDRMLSVKWKFELPPLLPSKKLKPVSDGKPNWVEAADQLPDGVMIGGFEKENLYIIRAPHRGSLTPGKFVPSEGVGYVSWGGDAHEKNTFEVLCGFDCIWVPTWEDRIPVDAVVGGFSEDQHETLYVGRALHDGNLIPGKVQPSHKVCYVSFKGKEIGKKSYEILVEPFSNNRCVNKLFISDMDIDHHYDDDDDDDDSQDDNYGFVDQEAWGDGPL